jgi:ERCC4-related helicase
MTASPGGELTKENTIKKIGQLCLNMNSTICTPTNQEELNKHVHKPQLEVIPVLLTHEQDATIKFLINFMKDIISKLKSLGCTDLPKTDDLPTFAAHFQRMSEEV